MSQMLGIAILSVLSVSIYGCNQTFGLTETEVGQTSEVCRCTCNSPPITTPGLKIVTDFDDGQQVATNTPDLASRTLNLGTFFTGGAPTTVGFRYQRLGIPKGAIIQSAFIQFTSGAGLAGAA